MHQEWYLSLIFTAIPMLIQVITILAGFYWCFHAHSLSLRMYESLLEHICHTNWCYTVTQILANEIFNTYKYEC